VERGDVAQAGRLPAPDHVLGHAMGTLAPDDFGPAERRAAARLLHRLMWLLGPDAAAEQGGPDVPDAEPRIVTWLPAPALTTPRGGRNAGIPPGRSALGTSPPGAAHGVP
jgi:hypothetical protein